MGALFNESEQLGSHVQFPIPTSKPVSPVGGLHATASPSRVRGAFSTPFKIRTRVQNGPVSYQYVTRFALWRRAEASALRFSMSASRLAMSWRLS